MFEYLTPEGQLARAGEIYRAALAAPFYRQKYAGRPAPAHAEDWRRLPPLTRSELYRHAYPRSRDMLTRPVEGMIISSTGGTSGVARYTVLTHREWELFCRMQAGALERMGLGPADRVANLFVAGHLWPSFLGVHEALKMAGCVHLPISANIPPPEIMRLCREFDPTVILSLPTMLVFLADLALKDQVRFPSLRLLGYAGEQMSSHAQDHVRRGLGVEQVKALAYSSADCGLMGYQCPRCGFGTYHLPSAFQMLEVVDPDSLQPLPAGEEGEVLVTNLGRTSLPIIRYRIGDLAAFISEPCPCRDPNPRFRLAGRAGEDFKLGGAYVCMAQFERALSRFPELSPNFMVELEDVGNQMEIRLRVESLDPAAARACDSGLRRALGRSIPEIPTGLELDYIRRLDIQYLEPGSLPRNPNTGKVIRLKDLRVVEQKPGTGRDKGGGEDPLRT